MIPPDPPEDDPLAAEDIVEISRFSGRFEDAWKRGDSPAIEPLVAEAPERLRSRLISELIQIEVECRKARGESPCRDDYLDRFLTHSALIQKLLPARPRARSADAARGLLFGLIAFQNGFINRDALLGAFNAWADDKSRPIGRLLLERGAIDTQLHDLLEGLVQKHLESHGNDPEKSLADLSSLGSARTDLKSVPDAGLQASLSMVGAGRTDPEATAEFHSTGRSAGDRFRILKLHAKGGLGEVFVALDGELNREVALKQILDKHADNPTSRHRFVVEAELTGGLEHPGIVPVYGLGAYEGGRP